MFSRSIRYAACSLIGIATLFLAIGVLLFEAAFVTGAASDYTIPLSWYSVLGSVIWPPRLGQSLLLLGVLFLAIVTSFMFFRAPRSIGIAVLLLQAVLAGSYGGALGLFFISREFETYHFTMNAERLGEYWFIYEAVAVWALAAGTLAVIRIFARKQPAENTQS